MISKKKLIIVLAITAIMLFVVGYFSMKRGNPTLDFSINSMPKNVEIVLKTNNLVSLFRNFRNGNAIWNEMQQISSLKLIDNQFIFLDSLLSKNEDAHDFISSNPCLFGIFPNEKGKNDYLAILGIEDAEEEKQVIKFMTGLYQGKNTILESSFNGASVFQVSPINCKKKSGFWFACRKKVFLLSNSYELIRQSLLQQADKKSLLSNQQFQEAWKYADANVPLSIFINFQQLSHFLQKKLHNDYRYLARASENFAEWAVFNLQMKDDEYNMKGFFITSDSSTKYEKILQHQTAEKLELINILPENTASFLSFRINNAKSFKDDYKNYLNGLNKYNEYDAKIQDIKIDYGIDIEQVFYPILKGEIGLVYAKNSLKNHSPFLILKTINKDDAKKALQKALQNYSKTKNIAMTSLCRKVKIDKEEKIDVYTMPFPDAINRLFGYLFHSPDVNYYTFLDDYLILGNSASALAEFYAQQKTGKLLKNLKSYETASSNFSTSLVYFYCNIPRSSYFYSDILSKELQKDFITNAPVINQLENFSFDIKLENEKMWTNLFLKYNPMQDKGVETLWKAEMDSLPRTRPQLVVNHITKEKDVFVQDVNNTIYLLDKNGHLLWKRQLDEPLLGEVYQIDYYKNSKLQLLFNTRSKIYCIDREGRNVEDYPIKLKSPAANGLVVFDFDNKREYRIHLALTNKKIVVLDKTGKAVKDWIFKQKNDVVNNPIQYCTLRGKDYLMISDNNTTYFVDKRGNKRFTLKEKFVKAKNSKFYLDTKYENSKIALLTTDSTGNVIYVNFDGKIERIYIADFSSNHYFDFEDIDNDGNKDFIFCDENKIEVYSHKRTKLFSYEFSDNVVDRPVVFKFSEKEKKIGIYLRSKNEIYLVNNDGKITKGFPLPAQGMFSIGFPQTNNSTTIFNLIVAGKNNTLNSYEIR